MRRTWMKIALCLAFAAIGTASECDYCYVAGPCDNEPNGGLDGDWELKTLNYVRITGQEPGYSFPDGRLLSGRLIFKSTSWDGDKHHGMVSASYTVIYKGIAGPAQYPLGTFDYNRSTKIVVIHNAKLSKSFPVVGNSIEVSGELPLVGAVDATFSR